MSDYPKMPDGTLIEYGSPASMEQEYPEPMYTAAEMRAYVDADRAMRVGWRPVSEKAPISTDLLLHISSGLVTVGMRWSGGAWDWPDGVYSDDNEGSVLHWMPLLQPPKD